MQDFEAWSINNLAKYTGRSCRKLGMFDEEGFPWMIKLQDNLRTKIKGIDLSYSNSPITEYIGSKVFHECGFDTHEVKLGMYRGKVAIAVGILLIHHQKSYNA